MNDPKAGISYYHEQRDNFYSTELDPEARAHIRLTMELLIENEDRYIARAKYLLKNHLLRVQFGDDLVEYYINNNQASFGLWEKQSNGFQNLEQIGLSRRRKERIVSLVELFATSEARIISGF
jgi:hypothetical protein